MGDFESNGGTFGIAAASSPPSGTDNTIAIYEDAIYGIRASDFGSSTPATA